MSKVHDTHCQYKQGNVFLCTSHAQAAVELLQTQFPKTAMSCAAKTAYNFMMRSATPPALEIGTGIKSWVLSSI